MVVPSSLGLGPCLGGLAPMWALRGAGGPEPHPTGAAWLLAAKLHGLHGLHVGTLYGQRTEGSATR